MGNDWAGFVRDTLGCGCGDAVLRRIERVDGLDSLAGVPLRLALDVGGRLLVAGVDERELVDDAELLNRLLEAGRRLRDERGMNRFRLAVVAEVSTDSNQLECALIARAGFHDERVHLHVIGPQEIPALEKHQ